MTDKKISQRREKLLVDLERIVGNSCYNGSIQNWGPGGEFHGEGREFRYPLTVVDAQGNRRKIKYRSDSFHPDEAITGYYAFGANQLQIMLALDAVLRHLEENYGLKT